MHLRAWFKKHGRDEFWIFFGFVLVEFFKWGNKFGIVILVGNFLASQVLILRVGILQKVLPTICLIDKILHLKPTIKKIVYLETVDEMNPLLSVYPPPSNSHIFRLSDLLQLELL